MDISTKAPIPVRLALALALLCIPVPLAAQTAAGPVAADMSPRVLFVVSGGFWQEEIAAETSGEASEDASAVQARGYFRAIAIRSEDNTSRLYLQRIRLGENGPDVLESSEIEALTNLRVYITDMRPESSSGVAERPGFAAFIYLKEDPAAAEPDTYELFVDDFGDMSFAPATN